MGGGVGFNDAAADVEDWALSLTDEFDGLFDGPAVWGGDGPVSGQFDLGWPDEVEFGVLDVLGDVDEDWPGTAGGCQVEGFGDDLRDLGGVGDDEVVFCDRHGDAADVGFLESVSAENGAGHLAGDSDDRHGIQVGVGDGGDQVGGAGPGGGNAHPDFAGDLCVAGCGVAGALFVSDEDVP